MKLHKCDCVYAIFPFGNYAPVCMRVMEKTKQYKDLFQCVEKGCKYYEKSPLVKEDEQ